MNVIQETYWRDMKVVFFEESEDGTNKFFGIAKDGWIQIFRVKAAKRDSYKDGFEIRATKTHLVCTDGMDGLIFILQDACHSGISPRCRQTMLGLLDWVWHNTNTVSEKTAKKYKDAYYKMYPSIRWNCDPLRQLCVSQEPHEAGEDMEVGEYVPGVPAVGEDVGDFIP